MCLGMEGEDSKGALQPEAPAGWETQVFPRGLAGMVVVLPVGPHRDEPPGQGRAMAEVSFHSELLCLHRRGGATRLQPDIARAWLGEARSAGDESPAA